MDSPNPVDEAHSRDTPGLVCEKIGNPMTVDPVYKIKGNYTTKEEYIEESPKHLEVATPPTGVGDA